MGKIKYILPIVFLVVGCAKVVTPTDVATAESLCTKRGGYTGIYTEQGSGLVAYCKDGSMLQVIIEAQK